jgi:succinyl-diaminopimelate desuccinylase
MTIDDGDAAVVLAAELVRMPSFDAGGEAALAERLADRLDAAGLDVVLHRGAGRTNVIARLAGAGKRPVCLSGHLDTVGVEPEDWVRDPFDGGLVDGVLHGRGACDMKGGVAAAVVAAERWAQVPRERRPGLLVVLSGGEEIGCVGALSVAEDLEPADAVIVLEPTAGRPRLGHRGAAWIDVTALGVAAHASAPHLGRSAISASARAIVALESIEHGSHPTFGSSTLNVGRIAGGSAPNIVADRCGFTVDVRLLPGQSAADWIRHVREVLPCAAEIEAILELPAVLLDPAAPGARRVLAALDLPAPTGGVSFFTDASVLTQALDAPAIVWGPGDPALAHAANERCRSDEIAAVARRLADLPRRWRMT